MEFVIHIKQIRKETYQTRFVSRIEHGNVQIEEYTSEGVIHLTNKRITWTEIITTQLRPIKAVLEHTVRNIKDA